MFLIRNRRLPTLAVALNTAQRDCILAVDAVAFDNPQSSAFSTGSICSARVSASFISFKQIQGKLQATNYSVHGETVLNFLTLASQYNFSASFINPVENTGKGGESSGLVLIVVDDGETNEEA